CCSEKYSDRKALPSCCSRTRSAASASWASSRSKAAPADAGSARSGADRTLQSSMRSWKSSGAEFSAAGYRRPLDVTMSDQALREDLKNAMLAKDRVRTSVLRGVLAAAKNRAIERKEALLPEPELVAIIRREIKQRNETLEFARQAGRSETVAELTEEL